jgi:hypothetical protein
MSGGILKKEKKKVGNMERKEKRKCRVKRSM